MSFIKVDKEYVLNDKDLIKVSGMLAMWEGLSKEEYASCCRRTFYEHYEFIKQLAPSIKEYFDEYARRVSPSAKVASHTFYLKRMFQRLENEAENYEGRAFYTSNLAFILLLLEAGLDVYKEIHHDYSCYISPYCFRKRRKSACRLETRGVKLFV